MKKYNSFGGSSMNAKGNEKSDMEIIDGNILFILLM